MDIHILAGKCSEICNEKIFEIIKNRDKSKNHIIIAPDRTLFSLEQRLFDGAFHAVGEPIEVPATRDGHHKSFISLFEGNILRFCPLF